MISFKYELGEVLIRNYPDFQVDMFCKSEPTEWTITKRIYEHFYQEANNYLDWSKTYRYQIHNSQYGSVYVGERFLETEGLCE